MTVEYQAWNPICHEYQSRRIDVDDVESVYESALGQDAPTFTWTNAGDDVIIVAVGDDYSVVSLLAAGTWYYLRVTDSDEETEIPTGGESAIVPKGAICPREWGLKILKQADDIASLLSRYWWSEN